MRRWLRPPRPALERAGGEATSEVCRPVLDTCSACRDVDGDGRGLGRCGPSGSVSAVDCDDLEPLAYYDADDGQHPFPERCADDDWNCNGVYDSVEVVAQPSVYGADHCGACDSPCTLTQAGPDVAAVACLGGECTVTGCNEGTSDCDGDLANGCEAAGAGTGGFDYYPDADGDGYGDRTAEPLARCEDLPQILVGSYVFVQNADDCNDDPAADGASYHPGATDYCDGEDQNCNGTIGDDGVDPTETVESVCPSDILGACRSGATLSCDGDGQVTCNPATPGDREICGNGIDDDCDGGADASDPDLPVEVCDGIDNDCNDGIDEAAGLVTPTNRPIGSACTATAAQGVCRDGKWACNGGVPSCAAGSPKPMTTIETDTDRDCDGVNDDEAYVFFSPTRPGGCSGGAGTAGCPHVGNPGEPLAGLNGVMSSIAGSGKSIILANDQGAYETNEFIQLKSNVSVSGAWAYTGSGTWTRTTGRAAITRSSTVDPSYSGRANVGIMASFVRAPGTVLENIDLTVKQPAAGNNGWSAIGIYGFDAGGLTLRNVSVTVEDAIDANQVALDPGNDGLQASCGPLGTEAVGRPGKPGERAYRYDYFPRGLWGAKAGPDGGNGGHGTDGVVANDSGCGGKGGPGGQPGGSSIGIMLFGSAGVTADGVAASVGSGGPGQPGADGGNGGSGLYLCFYGCSWVTPAGGGGAGGGGGNGGHSIAYVFDRSTSSTLLSEASVGTLGSGGDGGPGGDGGMPGASGSRTSTAQGANGPPGAKGWSLGKLCLDCSVRDADDTPESCLHGHDGLRTITVTDAATNQNQELQEAYCRDGWTLVMAHSSSQTAPVSITAASIATGDTVVGNRAALPDGAVSYTAGVNHWNGLGNRVLFETGSSSTQVAHRGSYAFFLDNGDDHRLWVADEHLIVGTTSWGQLGVGAQRLSTSDRDLDGSSYGCAGDKGGPWWYGVDPEEDGTNIPTSCFRSSIWGNGDDDPWFNTAVSQDAYGGMWVKDVHPYRNCTDIQAAGLGDGWHLIDPDGAGDADGDDPPFMTYCMDVWTLVALNSQYPTPPTPTWDESIAVTGASGDANLDGVDLWVNVKHWQVIGSHDGNTPRLRMQMGDSFYNIRQRADYDFSVDPDTRALHLTNEFLAGDSRSPALYTHHNDVPLSTRDRDNDSRDGSCAALFENTPWWYVNCWSGSLWGHPELPAYNRPYWDGAGVHGDGYDWGAIFVH